MRAIVRYVFLLSIALAATCRANEIDGMKLGMSIGQIRTILPSLGYTLDPIRFPGASDNWRSYALMKGNSSRGMISLCKDILSQIEKNEISLHEATSFFENWSHSLGRPPEIKAQQGHGAEGALASWINFQWDGEDNVRRRITIWQHGGQRPDIQYAFSYISTPCSRR
jgi:hypothetical protein